MQSPRSPYCKLFTIMANRIFTRSIAIIYLLFGVCAFVPACNGAPSPNTPDSLKVMLHFENLFGQFPMNYLLGAVLIGYGVAGLAASVRFESSRAFARVLFVTAVVLMGLGLCPMPVGTLGGLIPLFEWTTGFFLVTSLLTLYFAFFDGPLPASANRPVFKQ